METEHIPERKECRKIRHRHRKSEDERRYDRQGRRLLRTADGEHGFEFVGAALLVGKALPFRVRIVTMMVGVDAFAIAAAQARDHIGLPMLLVLMDIQSNHGEQIPAGEQRRGDDGNPILDVSFPLHLCKVSKKKIIFTIPISYDRNE
jgi:hypothetical protein